MLVILAAVTLIALVVFAIFYFAGGSGDRDE